ncbi:MAG: MarR family transcriptional regulator [Polyangia bacterium]|jgi:DNA-binding MarR family transcriptional regulator
MDAAKIWSLNYRLLMSVLGSVASELAALGLEPKELFLLSEVDANPHPAALASALCMPKPTVTVYLKRLESAGFVRRDIDPADLRRHRLTLTPMGRLVMQSGQDLLMKVFGERLGRLDKQEQAQLQTLLEKMG